MEKECDHAINGKALICALCEAIKPGCKQISDVWKYVRTIDNPFTGKISYEEYPTGDCQKYLFHTTCLCCKKQICVRIVDFCSFSYKKSFSCERIPTKNNVLKVLINVHRDVKSRHDLTSLESMTKSCHKESIIRTENRWYPKTLMDDAKEFLRENTEDGDFFRMLVIEVEGRWYPKESLDHLLPEEPSSMMHIWQSYEYD